jgi:CheY-like chemotaxis protein
MRPAPPSRSRKTPRRIQPCHRPSPGTVRVDAEDNDINAMLARATLLKAGHRVKVVSNGKGCRRGCHRRGLKHRFDVVLMDLHMPVMDGLDAIAAIRRHEEEMGHAAGSDHGAVSRQPGKRPATPCSPMAPAAS